jgi:transposase-like protein
MAKRASQEREQFWRELIGRQPASGVSIAQFCKQTGVSANSFFVWKRRLRRQNDQANRGKPTSSRSRTRPLARSSRSNDFTAAASPLVPVRLVVDPVHRKALNAGAIEVEWPDGVILRMSAGCDPNAVRDLMKTLASLLVGDGASC